MDYRTQKELLGETRLSALFSPLLANRLLWVEAIVIPIIGIGLCYLASPADPFFINKGDSRGPGSHRAVRCATSDGGLTSSATL